MKASYEFSPDAAIKYMRDQTDARFDRAYSYDLASRLSEAYTRSEAEQSLLKAL